MDKIKFKKPTEEEEKKKREEILKQFR